MRRRIYLATLASVLTFTQLGCGSNNSPPANQQPGATPTPTPSPVAVPFPVPVPVPIPEPFPVPVPQPRNGWVYAQERRTCGHDCSNGDLDFAVFADGSFVASAQGSQSFVGKIRSDELDNLDSLASPLARQDLKHDMSCFQADFDTSNPQVYDSLELTNQALYPIYLVIPDQQVYCFNDGFERARAYHLYVQFLANKYAVVPMPSPSPSVSPSPTVTPSPSVTVTISPSP